MKKTRFAIIVLLLALTLAGCQPANVAPADTTTGAETTLSPTSPPETTTVAPATVSIVENGKSDYMILRADRATGAEIDAALALREAIDKACGVRLRIVNELDAQPKKAIIVGNVNYGGAAEIAAGLSEGDYIIAMSGEHLVVCGDVPERTSLAVEYLTEHYLTDALAVPEGICELLNFIPSEPTVAAEFTVMSFNLLVAKTADLPRFEAALTQIKQASPDVLGVQECSVAWYEFLCESLGEEYGVVGELNSDTQKWRNAIFYRKARFELLDTKTQWLSANPSTSSMLPGENQYRILTYAVLRDTRSGATFAHCNTHMTIIEKVRQTQFNVLVKLLDKIQYPIVLTGDFNTREGSEYYGKITAAGYQSAHNMTADFDPAHTCGSGVIDFCFVDTDRFGVVSHDVLAETVNGVEPSDHNAVVVKVRLYN